MALVRFLRGNSAASRAFAPLKQSFFSTSATPITATLLPGDGIGHEIAELVKQVVRGVVESLKIITWQASLRVAEFAFTTPRRTAVRESAIHKANIMCKTDGLFLKAALNFSLVKNPALFDVLVMPNLYGDIISDLCAGLIESCKPNCSSP